jgi:hypothetical protein
VNWVIAGDMMFSIGPVNRQLSRSAARADAGLRVPVSLVIVGRLSTRGQARTRGAFRLTGTRSSSWACWLRGYLRFWVAPKLNIMSPALRLGMRPRQAVGVHGDHLKKTHHPRHGLLITDLLGADVVGNKRGQFTYIALLSGRLVERRCGDISKLSPFNAVGEGLLAGFAKAGNTSDKEQSAYELEAQDDRLAIGRGRSSA